MALIRPIDTIPSAPEFKVLCDGLLRFELGKLVQTFGSDGSDGGVDAEYIGAIDGTSGRWVFQYKFRSREAGIFKRRSWLTERYTRAKNSPSEFDKDGLKDAHGYILMTNVPVTPTIVQKLKTEWRKRKHKGPICIWDPSRLNAMIKGHEHLARSWTGAKEARCLQAVILPTWQWLQAAQAATLNWMNDPLWPLEIEAYQRPVPVGAFHQNFTWQYGIRFAGRSGPLVQIRSDPQFGYARAVPYRRALQPFDEVSRAVETLGDAVLRNIYHLRDELTAQLPQLQQFEDPQQREEIACALAFCVLENRWGFPMRGLHSIRDGHLVIRGRYHAWEEPALPDIEPVLDELVRTVQHGSVDEQVVAARAAVVRAVQLWWPLLWQVVSFGIDAEPEDTGEG